MLLPDYSQFIKLASKYNLIPIYAEWLADTQTPISIFKSLDNGKPSFLFESVEGGEKFGRYSFLGFNPLWTFESKNGQNTLHYQNGTTEKLQGPPLKVLSNIINNYQSPDLGLPRYFAGAAGIFAYDLVRQFETLPENLPDELGIPDCSLMFPELVLVYDHVYHTLKTIINTQVDGSPQASYHRAQQLIDRVKKQLSTVHTIPPLTPPMQQDSSFSIKPEANTSKQEFMHAVKKAKGYIASGDILQVVLSVRFRVAKEEETFNIYRRLRNINPSPYMFYVNTGSVVSVGASPEMLAQVENGVVRTRPIAGTRPRGSTAEADLNQEHVLKNDLKERAEHLMLLDLGRNDVSRVCRAGTVSVGQFMEVERYSHVMHLTSAVEGSLRAEEGPFSAFTALFPAGTVSGAPKIRAMEIIEELEKSRRGLYAGAVGYMSLSGHLDTCIAIRTALIKADSVYVQAGAGIVADSDPEKEYEEVVQKASALLKALA